MCGMTLNCLWKKKKQWDDSENAAKKLALKNCVRNTRQSFMLSIEAKEVIFETISDS